MGKRGSRHRGLAGMPEYARGAAQSIRANNGASPGLSTSTSPPLTPWGPARSSQTLCPARGKWEDTLFPLPNCCEQLSSGTAIS